MVDLENVSFGTSEISLKDNNVTTSVLPQNARELQRNIIIRGNVILQRGVFGNNIEIEEGNVTFKGAVFANNELHVSSDISDKIVFEKAVASADSIAAFTNSEKVYFGADLNAEKIRLKNCYVGGSIFGSEVYLENCVVLGGVFATKQAVISSCLVGTFNGPSVELAGINYILYPACFSVEPLTYLPQTELYNISLAHLGALFKGEQQDENTGKIKMDLVSDKQKSILVGDDNSSMIINSYSVSSRVLVADMLNLEKLENHFLIGAGALGSQVLKAYSLQRQDGEKSKELTVENIAEFMFGILSGVIEIQDLVGEISFAELKKNLE